jgi:phosphatidylglycerol lysyltransferase
VTSSTDVRLAALRRHGEDAVAFQALESGIEWWEETVPYLPTARSWIAVGSPLVEAQARRAAVQRFCAAARQAGRRPVFMCVETLDAFNGCRSLMVGLQPSLRPPAWRASLRGHTRLREQVRRARAKGVIARVVDATELAPGTPLRDTVNRLQQQWLDARAMEPMTFLVSVEPFHAPKEHQYLIAERHGAVVQFLSAVPVYGRRGWLVEDVFRSPAAPNGTTELLLNRLLDELDDDQSVVLGLTPLTGAVPWWLTIVRHLTVPLYHFDGLRRFRARLRPPTWAPIWLVWDRGPAPLVILDVLRAFSGGRPLRFLWRTLTRHPQGPPWAVVLPLVPWTILLAIIAASGQSQLLGFSSSVLWAWVLFDAMLAWLLFRVAARPRLRPLMLLTAAVAADAVYSVAHLLTVDLGAGIAAPALRLLATLGPIVGTLGLALASVRRSQSA